MIFKYFPFVFLTLSLTGYFFIKPLVSSSNINEVVKKEVADCATKNGADKCYSRAAERLLKDFDYKELLVSFQGLEADPRVFADCHEILHYLGRLEYRRSGNIKKAMSESSPVCFSGAYHGVLEEYLSSKKVDIADPAQLSEICGTEQDLFQRGVHDQCQHGLGHALISVTDGNLNLSLDSCGLLADARSNEQCQSGIFMEIFNSSTNKDHPWQFAKSGDPLYPCNELTYKYQKMCYTLVVPRLFHLFDNDWQKSILFCRNFPEEFKEACFHQLGSLLIGNFQDLKTIKDNCVWLKEKELKKMCITGVVNTYAIRYAGNSDKIREFCFILGPEEKNICYEQMWASLLGWLKRDEIIAECEKIPAEYRNFCLH